MKFLNFKVLIEFNKISKTKNLFVPYYNYPAQSCHLWNRDWAFITYQLCYIFLKITPYALLTAVCCLETMPPNWPALLSKVLKFFSHFLYFHSKFLSSYYVLCQYSYDAVTSNNNLRILCITEIISHNSRD